MPIRSLNPNSPAAFSKNVSNPKPRFAGGSQELPQFSDEFIHSRKALLKKQSKQHSNFEFPFSKKESLLIALYLLGSFAGVTKFLTGRLPLQNLTPQPFDGYSGWPENTTVLAAGGQDVFHQISNKWGGKKQMYVDYFVDQIPSSQGISEAHAKLSQSGFRNFYLQNIYPVSSFDLPLEMRDGQLQLAQCPNTFKKTDNPSTQHIILVAGKDASTQKVEHMLREQFPLIPPDQITVLGNPTIEQLQQSLSATRKTISQQLQDSQSKKNAPQLLLYYQGHGGIFNKPDLQASEGSHIGGVLLANGLVDEKWFADEMSKFPTSIEKTLIFDSCQSGSFIKV